MAIESFQVFDRLQRDSVIPAGVRFQVAIPSPLAPAYNYIGRRSRAAFLEVFGNHLIGEVQRLAAALPGERLAVQWDVLQEILIWENYFPDRPDDYQEQITSTLGRLGDAVPRPIELGYHFCYGSPKDEHLVQPRDAGILATAIRATVSNVKRPVDFLHFPVPKDRTDEAFYRPLSALSLPKATELYAGLVHVDDEAGNRKRLELARRHAVITGVATECGWGRGDPARVPRLIQALKSCVQS